MDNSHYLHDIQDSLRIGTDRELHQTSPRTADYNNNNNNNNYISYDIEKHKISYSIEMQLMRNYNSLKYIQRK